ncbi:MAG: hypothetical protein AAF824_10225 [Bacteroidota bacterium]
MNRLLGIIVLVLLFSACIEDDAPVPFCDVANPVEDLPWLRDIIGTLEESIASNDNHFFDTFWVRQFTYQDTPYFMQGTCCASCFYPPIFYNCAGDTVSFTIPPEEAYNYWEIVSSGEIIWQGGACNF